MTDKNDALFLVRLPFGQKTIPYEEVPELIAMAKSPGYDIKKASGDEDVIFVLDVGFEERPLRAAVHAGKVEVLNKSLHRMGPPFIGRLEDTVLTVRALREYVESIHGFLEVEDAPEPQATTPSPAPEVEAPESLQPEQARAVDALAGLIEDAVFEVGASANAANVCTTLFQWAMDDAKPGRLLTDTTGDILRFKDGRYTKPITENALKQRIRRYLNRQNS